MPLLTIFTPAYNRKHTIGRTYESMCRQTCHDVEWLIIDDGSQDNTRELVLTWYDPSTLKTKDNEYDGYSKDAPWLKIRYVYQQNQGMHGAHNTAYDHITTELNTCIDSDDYAPDDCCEKIVKFWKSQSEGDRKKYAGIVGLDVYDSNKEIIGVPFPDQLKAVSFTDFSKFNITGDKKFVYRTDIVKRYPKYPLFEGERYAGLDYLYTMIDQDFQCLVLNEPLDIVDYQLDGSSFSMYKQYWNNPKGWCFYRSEMMKFKSSTPKFIFRQAIHYVSSSIRCGQYKNLICNPKPLYVLAALPLGIVLYFYIKRNVLKQSKFKF